MIYTLGDRKLETVGEDYYVAPSAQVIGSVILGRGATVWFNCVLRADSDRIIVGDGTNIQDGTIETCAVDQLDCVGNRPGWANRFATQLLKPLAHHQPDDRFILLTPASTPSKIRQR